MRNQEHETKASSNGPLLRLDNVSKRYGRVTALDGVTMSVNSGEVVGLVGDNGAGKSTIVKMISGVLSPDHGSIFFNGADRTWNSPHDALDAGIETLYQEGGLAPHLTVAGNLYLGREISRKGVLGRLGYLDNRGMERAADAALRRIGMTSVRPSAAVGSLSGGQRQAVAIARAVVWARKVIILDEPTNHLGVTEVSEVLRLVREVQQRGVSVIFISHTLPHVIEVTDRIVTLFLGRVVSDYPSKDVTMEQLVSDMTGVTENGRQSRVAGLPELAAGDAGRGDA